MCASTIDAASPLHAWLGWRTGAVQPSPDTPRQSFGRPRHVPNQLLLANLLASTVAVSVSVTWKRERLMPPRSVDAAPASAMWNRERLMPPRSTDAAPASAMWKQERLMPPRSIDAAPASVMWKRERSMPPRSVLLSSFWTQSHLGALLAWPERVRAVGVVPWLSASVLARSPLWWHFVEAHTHGSRGSSPICVVVGAAGSTRLSQSPCWISMWRCSADDVVVELSPGRAWAHVRSRET